MGRLQKERWDRSLFPITPSVTRVLGGEASGALNALALVRASGGGQCPCARRLSVLSSPRPYSTAVVARALIDSLDAISVFEAATVDGRACVRMVSLYALVRVPLVDTLDSSPRVFIRALALEWRLSFLRSSFHGGARVTPRG